MFKKQIKILIIDDENEYSFLLKRNLERRSYKVLVASDGKKGLQLARRHKPNLIFLDIMMPGMNGIEVLKNLKENVDTLSIPVVMLTGREDEQTKQMAASLYNEDYLVKPIDVEELHARIEKILGRRTEREGLRKA